MLGTKMLLEELASCLQLLECVFKSVEFFENLPLDKVRLDLDIQLGHVLVLCLLRAHILEILGLLLDFRQGLDGLLRGLARLVSSLDCFI